jgi:hypothetical protein
MAGVVVLFVEKDAGGFRQPGSPKAQFRGSNSGIGNWLGGKVDMGSDYRSGGINGVVVSKE